MNFTVTINIKYKTLHMQKVENPVQSSSEIGHVPSLHAFQSTHEMCKGVLINHLITVGGQSTSMHTIFDTSKP